MIARFPPLQDSRHPVTQPSDVPAVSSNDGLVTATVARLGSQGKMAGDDLVCPPPVSACDHPARRLALSMCVSRLAIATSKICSRSAVWMSPTTWCGDGFWSSGRCSPENFAIDARGQRRDGISTRWPLRLRAGSSGTLDAHGGCPLRAPERDD